MRVARSGLITVTGGKWTTYRAMAEDVLQHCVDSGRLPPRGPSRTARLTLVGAAGAQTAPISGPQGLHTYGGEAAAVAALPGAGHWLAGGLSEAMVRFAARFEYARTVEDVLARRVRMLFLDAKLAGSIAPRVAQILQEELGIDPQLDAFSAIAQQYATVPQP